VDGARGGQRSGAERASSACCSLRATCAGCVIQCGSCFMRVRTCGEPQGQHAQSSDSRNKGGGAEANAEGEQETAEEERRLPRAAPPRAHVRDARTHPRAARPRLSPAFALDRKPLMLRRSTSQHSQRENSLRMSSPQPIACKLNQDHLRLLPATAGCALATPPPTTTRSPRHRHLFLQLIHPLPTCSLRRRALPLVVPCFPPRVPVMSLVGASSAHLLPARDFSPPPALSPVCALSELLCSRSSTRFSPTSPTSSVSPLPPSHPTHHAHPPPPTNQTRMRTRALIPPHTAPRARARAQEEPTKARQRLGRATEVKCETDE